MENVLKVKTK